MLLLARYPEFFSLSFHHDCAGGVSTFHQESRLSALVSVSRHIHVGHESLVLQEKDSWLTYLLDEKVVGQALPLVRSFRLAPLLLLSGSVQWLADRECFCSHAEIYCCGLLSTRKSDCTGLPPSMLNNPETPQSRGQYRIRMKGNMSLICWYNKGHFRFLTNAYSPVQQGKQHSYCSSRKCTCFM